MAIEETAVAPTSTIPLAISDEDAAAELRGELIADEVSAPPKKGKEAKASTEAKESSRPADIMDGEDDDEGDSSLANKVLRGKADEDDGDDEDDDGDVVLAGPLKQLLADQKESYESRLAEAQEKIAALEVKATKADLTLDNIVEQAIAGKVSKEDILEIVSDLFYLVEPERADPEARHQLDRRKMTIEQRKIKQDLEAREAEMQERLLAAESNARYRALESEAHVATVTMADEIPHLMAVFGGDYKRVAAQALELAQRYAVNIDPDSPNIPDLSTGAMLKQLEREAEKLQNNLQSRKPVKQSKKAKSKALPVSEHLTQEEQDAADAAELRAAMNG